MELLEKFILQTRKRPDCRELQERSRSSEIASEQVRLLLFKECDWRGRKLLFDSSTVEKVVAGKYDKLSGKKSEFPSIVEVSDGYSYVYNGPAADSNLLGEMIFGAVAMNYKGVSLKIHIMDEPRRLMCTKVFCVPGSRRVSGVDRKNGEANSCAELSDGSKPLNLPSKRDKGVSLSFSLNRGDSGFYGDNSPFSSVNSTYDYFTMFDICKDNTQEEFYSFYSPPGRKLSTTSNGSWQRRTFQNIATRFDLGHRSSSSLSVPTVTSNISSCDSQLYSNSSASGTCDSLASTGSGLSPKKSKLGLALLITVADSEEMDVVRRCVEHSPQLQALVCRLRIAALTAGSGSGNSFIATLYRATADAAVWLSDLMHGPRLQPVWLNLVTSDEPKLANKLAESLLSDLCSVLSIGDTKHTNFFVSTLLTYVLTYHLGWVTTVSPYDIIEPQNPSECRSQAQRPYNALWAQLSDLCGAIGFPPRAARTIICGSSNIKFINRLLLVLTYFLRCGDVKRIDYKYQDCVVKESKVVSVESARLKRSASSLLEDSNMKLQPAECQNLDSTITLKSSEVSFKRTATLANLNGKLSTDIDLMLDNGSSSSEKPCGLRRNPTVLMTNNSSSESSLQSSVSEETEQVVFVLGDNEKLVGLKNKSGGGKSVKKSSKTQNDIEIQEKPIETCTKENCKNDSHSDCSEKSSKCCRQTLQHSKPIKHSGFKFEFDKYPQIVTNYMKSKNLEILDRHYIGKPGNLKLDNFQFDPTIVPPIQEERCEICYKCQLMESTLQTPTNASELEYMNDVPRQSEPQYAKESIVEIPQISPKNFIKRRKENTLVVNIDRPPENVAKPSTSVKLKKTEIEHKEKGIQKDNNVEVKRIVEFPLVECLESSFTKHRSGFDGSLLGGVTDHYVPDLILQGTTASPSTWETDLRRDIDLASHLNKNLEVSSQALAIIGDTNTWEVRVAGRSPGAGGMSALVAAMLDALPAMWRARVPPHQCLTFLEGKLREFCVLSKTLADMLMSTDFCDIVTLTKSLNIDVNDVPLLLAVATTHTPQVATRYGISYR